MRLDNSIFSNYNANTRRLFVDEPNLQDIIATGPPSRWRYQALHRVNFSIVSHQATPRDHNWQAMLLLYTTQPPT